jgi:hypothetical protein
LLVLAVYAGELAVFIVSAFGMPLA